MAVPMKFFGKRPTPPGPIAPAAPFTAIGDIHGCLDLLQQALEHAEGQIVCVGDYVDRGPDSAGVVRLLQDRRDVICLMGNHEEMMLDFLDAPETHGARWLRNGGVATLASFGIDPGGRTDDEQALREIRDDFRGAMGAALEGWLRALPSFWCSGNVAVVHGAADPNLPMEAQSTRALRWGHKDFGKIYRRDGMWVLRGHVIVDEAFARDGVISIDTGAFARGRLSLAHVSDAGVVFQEVGDGL